MSELRAYINIGFPAERREEREKRVISAATLAVSPHHKLVIFHSQHYSVENDLPSTGPLQEILQLHLHRLLIGVLRSCVDHLRF